MLTNEIIFSLSSFAFLQISCAHHNRDFIGFFSSDFNLYASCSDPTRYGQVGSGHRHIIIIYNYYYMHMAMALHKAIILYSMKIPKSSLVIV